MTRPAAAIVLALMAISVPAFAEWAAVKDWTGTGSKATETFQVASKEWRVTWSSTAQGDGAGASFGVLVYTEDKKLVASATGRVGMSDVTYVHEGPGRYYLDVTAANVNWKMAVEEDK